MLCVERGVWKMWSVENMKCGKYEVWKIWSVENRCGKRGVCKIQSVVSVTTHSAFTTLLIFHTRHFPHSSFSTLCIFHTLYFLHSSFSSLRTPPLPLNRRYLGVIMLTNRWFICIIPQPDWFNIVTKYIPSYVMQVAKEKFKGVISWDCISV